MTLKLKPALRPIPDNELYRYRNNHSIDWFCLWNGRDVKYIPSYYTNAHNQPLKGKAIAELKREVAQLKRDVLAFNKAVPTHLRVDGKSNFYILKSVEIPKNISPEELAAFYAQLARDSIEIENQSQTQVTCLLKASAKDTKMLYNLQQQREELMSRQGTLKRKARGILADVRAKTPNPEQQNIDRQAQKYTNWLRKHGYTVSKKKEVKNVKAKTSS